MKKQKEKRIIDDMQLVIDRYGIGVASLPFLEECLEDLEELRKEQDE